MIWAGGNNGSALSAAAALFGLVAAGRPHREFWHVRSGREIDQPWAASTFRFWSILLKKAAVATQRDQ